MMKTGDRCYGARVAGDMVTNVTVAGNETPLVIAISERATGRRVSSHQSNSGQDSKCYSNRDSDYKCQADKRHDDRAKK